MKRLLELVVKAAILMGLVKLGAQVLVPRRGHESSEDFQVPVVLAGIEFGSTARALRHGRVVTIFGGADVDLRGATLHPEGTVLEIVTVFGGARVLVNENWTVVATGEPRAGGQAVRVPEPDPSAGGPVLSISLTTWFGGVLISTDPDDRT